MVENREKQKIPIIGIAYGVVRGNSHASHKALPGDGFLFVQIKRPKTYQGRTNFIKNKKADRSAPHNAQRRIESAR